MSEKIKNFPTTVTFLVISLLLILQIFGQAFAEEGKILITALISSGYFLYLTAKRQLFFPSRFVSFYLIFLSLNFLSLFSSSSPYNSFLRVIELSSFLFLTILTYNIFLKQEMQKSLPRFLIILATFISAVTLFHYQSQSRAFLPYQSTQWPFAWPGLLAAFLLVVLPFSLRGLLTEKKQFLTVAKFLSTVFILWALLLTKSIWTFISLVLLLTLILTLSWSTLKKRLSLVFALGFVVLVLIYPLSWQRKDLTPSLRTIVFQTDFACYDSKDIQQAGKAMFFASLFLGHGPDSFKALYPTYQNQPWSESKFSFNEYLQVLVENGLLGLLSFFLILGYLFYLFFKQERGRGELTSTSFLALFIFLFYNLNDFSFRIQSLAVLFWVLVGFYLALKEKGKPAGRGLQLFSLFLFLLTTFLILGMFQFRQSQNYLLKGDFGKAKDRLSFLTKIFPFNPNYFVLKAEVETETDNFEEAIGDLKKAGSLERKNPEILYQLGTLYQKLGRQDEAESYLQKAIDLAPFSSPRPYNALIQIYLGRGETEKVNQIVNQATEKIFPLNEKFDDCVKYLREENIPRQLMPLYILREQST